MISKSTLAAVFVDNLKVAFSSANVGEELYVLGVPIGALFVVLPVLSLELTTLVDVVVWFEMTVGGELVVVPLLDKTLLRVIVIKAVLLIIIWVEGIDWIVEPLAILVISKSTLAAVFVDNLKVAFSSANVGEELYVLRVPVGA